MPAKDWFEKNPEGAAEVQQFIAARVAGSDAGALKDLKARLEEMGFAHSRRALSRYIAAVGGELPEKLRKPKKDPRPPNENWIRSDEWIEERMDADCWIVTSAVAHVEPEHDFLSALEGYAEHNGGHLFVVPLRYKNPTSQREAKAQNLPIEAWHESFYPYLVQNNFRLGDHEIKVMGKWKIQATSGNPIRGQMSSVSKGDSAIFGHTQLSMRSAPTVRERTQPKMLWSTGAATQAEYSDTVAGQLAEFHHSHSAVVVHNRDGYYIAREVTWDGEKFADCGYYYYADGSYEETTPELCYLADPHGWDMDKDWYDATWGPQGMIEELRPKRVAEGDVFNGTSISHHERGKRLKEAARVMRGEDSLERELEDYANYMRDTQRDFVEERLELDANHEDFLDRWLENCSSKIEPINLPLFFKLSDRMCEDAKQGKHRRAIQIWIEEQAPDVAEWVRFLQVDERYPVAGVEAGMHGHVGLRGSRGSLASLSAIDIRFVIGHGHGPGIWKGGLQVGAGTHNTGPKKPGYANGPDDWMQLNAFIYDNGYRQTAMMVYGNW